MSRGQPMKKPPMQTPDRRWRDLGRRMKRGPSIPRSILALYYVAAVNDLATPEGRVRAAAFYRREFASARREGAETTLYLKAADAIDRQDWPALGRILRETERLDWNAEHLPNHRGILRLARWLESLSPGAAI